MADIKLQATIRKKSSKGAMNTLRKESNVPGVFYSSDSEPVSIYVPDTKINPIVFTSEAHVIYLSVDEGEEQSCVLKEVQFDPVTDKIIHFDLYGLTAGQELQMTIPVNLTGETPIGVREGGVLTLNKHQLEISCLPKHIPQSLEINVEEMEIGDSIHVRDLSYENVKIITPEKVLVVTVAAPRKEEETDVAEEGEFEEEPLEPEVIGKGKSEDEEQE